jgi:hypothetical protein
MLILLLFSISLLIAGPSYGEHFPAPAMTNLFAFFIGSFRINDVPAQPGDEIAFFDQQGVLCGRYVVDTEGSYGAVAVYGDDTKTGGDEGASPGTTLSVKIWQAAAGLEVAGPTLVLSGGTAVGNYTSSPVPPVWQDLGQYVLDVNTTTHFARPGVTTKVCDYAGSLMLLGGPASVGDEVAAFDPQGVLIGHAIVTESGKFGVMHLYGDDDSTTGVDEGAVGGDGVTFKVWDRSTSTEYGTENATMVFVPSEPPTGSFFVPSSVPPVWNQDAGYFLGIRVFASGQSQYEVSLNSGWNFVSTPVAPVYTAIEMAIQNISSPPRVIWGYDNEAKVWKRYIPGGQGNSLTAIEAGKGYWIYMDTAGSIVFVGTPASRTVHLYEGWNLVGYAGADGGGDPRTVLDGGVPGAWSLVWGWWADQWATKHETMSLSPVPELTEFRQGRAYWLRIKTGSGGIDWQQPGPSGP